MTRLFMKLAVLFASFNLLCLVYVGAKRRAHGQKEGWLGRILARGLDYVPILLFFACLGLFVTYVPFAEAFSHSTSPKGVWEAKRLGLCGSRSTPLRKLEKRGTAQSPVGLPRVRGRHRLSDRSGERRLT